jgi:uncharacterized membrane protein
MVDVAAPDNGVMSALTWTTPSALWLLLAIPAVWVAHRAARTNFNVRQRRLQAAIRSLLLGLLAVALARPVISSRSSRESIVYAVDVSQSVGTPAILDAARRIDEMQAAARPAHSRLVAFGATARTVEGTPALRRIAAADPATGGAGDVDRAGTDLEGALDSARGELAAGHVPRVVLFTDGRQTSGDARSGVARLAAGGIPVSVQPMAVRSLGDTWVASLDVPARMTAGASIPISVTVGSQREGDARVELRSDGEVLAQQTVHLAKGSTRVILDASIERPGATTFDAAVSLPGDPLAANDTLSRGVWIDPRVRVLYLESAPASARYLSSALTASGFDVTTRPPSGLPSSRAELDAFDAVVLSDVGLGAIPAQSMNALANWVENGGGLLVAGGEAVFGEGKGGYRKTTLERLTPVTFERREEPSVALILVLDRSWSMAGTSIDLCKAAAQAALDVMKDEQSLGVLTFNEKFDWDVTLRNVGRNRDAIRAKIGAIEPGGRTLIFPALEQAYLALRTVKARAKHVVLLSDGRTYPDDYEGLVRKMRDARITVSSIAVGPAADQELLRNIAKWGEGREYMVADAHELPQVFVKEAKDSTAPAFDEKKITAVVKRPAFLQDVDVSHLPPLRGLTSTVMKDSALQVIATTDDDPVLAFWPVGLGRTAVFASDVKDRWGADWVRWRGYGPFFTAVVHAIERQRTAPLSLDVVQAATRGNTESVALALEARDADGRYRDLLKPVLRVTSGRSPARDLTARQVAPGRYEAALVADARQPLSISVVDAATGGAPPSRTIVPDPAAEYRFQPADEDLLRAIVSATGGVWQPSPSALAAKPGERSTDRRPLSPVLLILALLTWLVDLVFRRVRVFE